jgi:hypothetical protein
MTRKPDDFSDLLGDAEGAERDELEQLIRQLSEKAPYPKPGFRAMMRRSIEMKAVRRKVQVRPARLRTLIAAYGLSGTVLLVVSAVGLAGLGPFAA